MQVLSGSTINRIMYVPFVSSRAVPVLGAEHVPREIFSLGLY